MSSKTRTRTVAPCRYGTGATVPAARYHTQQHTSLRADRRTFVLWLTPEQQEARNQAANVEAARCRNEHRANGLIMPSGAEW